ncbi:Rapid ALkalinization Factor [Macleaya cordata]|uniref:Rapid ALkalinization Factor n=1 Tax=Macleaya cordata TaxID=56857 RepID=A0A200Q5J2_MACCD|nr:Rapid ALkalinization Factor [Macleaya cordata]
MELQQTFLLLDLLFLLVLCVAHINLANATQIISFEYDQRGGGGACNASIGECNAEEEEEMLMESEISRRFMAEQKKYITPGVLKKDQPACGGDGRGQSYTNGGSCLGRPVNPETRPCYKYYRCRSD